MKNNIALLVTIIGSISLTSPSYAANIVDTRMGDGDKQIEIQSIQSRNEVIEIGTTGAKQQNSNSTCRTRSMRKIIDMPIYNTQGEERGEIEDIKFDTHDGKIRYVTVSKTGSRDAGGTAEIAVPLQVLRVEKNKIVLTVDQDKLNGAPRPGKPASADTFQRELHSHYGIAYPWEARDQNLKNLVEKKRAELIKDNIRPDIHGNTKTEQDDSPPMDEDAKRLRAEFRKLLLIFNPL